MKRAEQYIAAAADKLPPQNPNVGAVPKEIISL